MRTVFIDLTQDGHCRHDSIDVGYTGEHNATELVIAVPPSMADESEYLTAVFLSNGKIIRSEKITETQEDGKPYLTGNQVHILLSKRLTQSPTLGLQIEGYKKNKRGTSVLLGKSPFISSLHFHLSPQGEQDAAAGVDPDELSDLMDWWRNRSENDSPGENNDELYELLEWWRTRTDNEASDSDISEMLEWWRNRTDQVPGGIQKYESYHHLPRDADDGDMAYVLNDCGIPIAGTVASWVYYEGFNFRDNLDRDVLQPLTEIDLEEMEPTDVKRVGFTFRTDTDEDLCYFIMMYYAPVGSVFIFSQFACDLDTMEYLSSDYRGELSYMYCAGEGDVSPLFPGGFIDSESAYVTEGWYKVKETIVGYSSKDSYPEPIIRYVIEPIEGCDVVGLKTLRNCFVKVINGDYRTYEKEVLPMFTDFFDVYNACRFALRARQWRIRKRLPRCGEAAFLYGTEYCPAGERPALFGAVFREPRRSRGGKNKKIRRADMDFSCRTCYNKINKHIRERTYEIFETIYRNSADGASAVRRRSLREKRSRRERFRKKRRFAGGKERRSDDPVYKRRPLRR